MRLNHRGDRSVVRWSRSSWISIAALLVAVVVAVVVVIVVTPRNEGTVIGNRHIVARKTAAQAFPHGLAVQPVAESLPARELAKARQAGRTATAAAIDVIASQPIATWLGDWHSAKETVAIVHAVIANAKQQGRTPTFVLYAVPNRDCGGYSKGGFTEAAYEPWVRSVAAAMHGSDAVVLLEPDSIAQISNCPALDHTRLPMLRTAVDTLAAAHVTTYIDGGNENRVPVATMAKRLREAGIDEVQGFFTNVSNFYRVDSERKYADDLANAVGGDPHYVIDVSRNGKGWLGTWCNPVGAGLGQTPRVATSGASRLDALLWVKTPGASDGTCNGGPAAGSWWEQYAVDLVRNR